MTRINLLPWREMRRKEQDRQLVRLAIVSSVLMAVIVLAGWWHFNLLIENQAGRNQFLTTEIAKVEEQIKEINALKKQRNDLIARMQVIERLQGERSQIVQVFDEFARRLPEGAYLTSLRQSGTNFTLQGIAQSNGRVSTLMRNLDGSNWLQNTDLDVINVSSKGSDRVSQFTLRVTQTDKAAAEKPAGAK